MHKNVIIVVGNEDELLSTTKIITEHFIGKRTTIRLHDSSNIAKSILYRKTESPIIDELKEFTAKVMLIHKGSNYDTDLDDLENYKVGIVVSGDIDPELKIVIDECVNIYTTSETMLKTEQYKVEIDIYLNKLEYWNENDDYRPTYNTRRVWRIFI